MQDTLAEGLPIRVVTPGSPADRAGLCVGDTILIANGIRVASLEAYIEARKVRKDLLAVTIQRGQKILDLEIRLQDS